MHEQVGTERNKEDTGQLPNGAAIALLATGYVSPLLASAGKPWMSIAVIAAGAGLHWLARRAVRDMED
jgi:hypothetical protein